MTEPLPPDTPESEELAQAIHAAWKATLDDFDAVGMSVLGATQGLGRGPNGQAIYRMSMTEAARMAAKIAIIHRRNQQAEGS